MTVSNTRHSHDILIADARIEDLHVLLAGRAAGLETWLVQPDEDALGLIFKALAQPGLARLHLLAHGAPGEIRLGDRPLTAADFRARFDGAAQRDLDIALWSCGTGAGEAGQEFVRALAAATGARVSAATGLVGAAEKGGNWDLGVTAPFSAEARAGFGGVLTLTTTFIALESGGTLSFGGDATGDIALTVAADGALTAVRGGVTATAHPNIKDITSVTTGGVTITLAGAAALGNTNFPQGTDTTIANAGQVFRTVDINSTKYYFPATVAELGSAGVFVLKNGTDAYSGAALKPGFAFYATAGIAAITNHKVLTNDIATLPDALKVYGVTLGIDPTKADTLDLNGITKAAFESQIANSVQVAIGTDAYFYFVTLI